MFGRIKTGSFLTFLVACIVVMLFFAETMRVQKIAHEAVTLIEKTFPQNIPTCLVHEKCKLYGTRDSLWLYYYDGTEQILDADTYDREHIDTMKFVAFDLSYHGKKIVINKL